VSGHGGIPRPLLIGACIEAWAADDAVIPSLSARRRFSDVRRWWLDAAGILPGREAFETIPPPGAPWSVEYLSYRGQAARVGRPVKVLVAERLARAGCTVADLGALNVEAEQLWLLAKPAGAGLPRVV